MSDKFKDITGSIAVKTGGAVFAMCSMALAAIVISLVVFQSLSASLNRFQSDLLPDMSTTTTVLDVAGNVTAGLSDLLLARSKTESQAVSAELRDTQDSLRSSMRNLEGDLKTQLLRQLDNVDDDIAKMNKSLERRFDVQADLDAMIASFDDLSNDVRYRLLELSDDAYFELAVGGDVAVDQVSETMRHLIDVDVAQVQVTLVARSKVNLLTGLTLARIETTDQALDRILQGVADSALMSLDDAIAEAHSLPAIAAYLQPVIEMRDLVERLNAQSNLRGASLRNQILDLRSQMDRALATALDNSAFEMMLDSEAVSVKNRATIQAMLDRSVQRIQSATDIDDAIGAMFSFALMGVLAPDADTAAGAQLRLDAALNELKGALEQLETPDAIAPLVVRMANIAHPEHGAIGLRLRVIAAKNTALEDSIAASQGLRTIVDLVDQHSKDVVNEMLDAGQYLLDKAHNARLNMMVIGVVSLIIGILALLGTWFLIVRPLQRLTVVTERLAGGDIEEIGGFNNPSGEIGRLLSAMKVFRENLIERERMQAAEKEREAEIRKAQQQAEQDRHEREEADRQREAEAARAELQRAEEERQREIAAMEEQRRHEEEQRLREIEERHERDRLRAEAEAERAERAAEQQAVVQALEQALGKLSQGDLTCQIDREFAEGYENLRKNFNSAVTALNNLVAKLGTSVGVVHESATEMTKNSAILSGETDSVAAALDETAAALTQLSVSAKESRQLTVEANGVMENARRRAEDTSEIVVSTVNTITNIEKSSGEIIKIVEMIDAIAFQTNLLALNASVEAARAGANGKGFAVVASEVRVLAQRSSDAAREIDDLISSTVRQIQQGVAEVGDAENALSEIISMVGTLAEHFTSISATSEEQSSTIVMISDSMNTLDSSTQGNAAISSTTATTSQRLSDEALMLKGLVDYFHFEAYDDGEADLHKRAS